MSVKLIMEDVTYILIAQIFMAVSNAENVRRDSTAQGLLDV